MNRLPTIDRPEGSPHSNSPPEWAERLLDGPISPEYIEELYCQHGSRVYALAMRMLGNQTDAEDITQEVFLQVVRRLDSFRGEAAFSTWLHRVTVNAVLALRRKRATARERQFGLSGEGREQELIPSPPSRYAEGVPEAALLGGELRDHLEAAIARLPEAYRDPFVLSDIEHFSNAEICELLGLTLAGVKSRLHRARLMLREALKPYLAHESTPV